MTAFRHLIVGPQRHGVVQHATFVAGDDPVVRCETVDDIPALDGPIHVHFTDGLFGDTAEKAAAALVPKLPAQYSMTVHDVPQPVDGAGRFERRRAGYREVLRLAEGVIVASEFERTHIREINSGPQIRVVPLPLKPPADGLVDEIGEPNTVGLCGFIYPGKGYDEVIAAAPQGWTVRLIGGVSRGHDDHVRDLAELSERCGVTLEVSGYLPHDEMLRELSRVQLPLAAHRHISASGSVGTWIEAGRKPFVPRHPYLAELAERCPGTVTFYDTLRGAFASSASTFLHPDVVVAPTIDEVRAMYAEALGAWLA